MIEQGALAELEGLRRRGLDPGLPLMKAVAVRELLGHIEGIPDLTEPFNRVREAIAEARKLGVAGRAAA